MLHMSKPVPSIFPDHQAKSFQISELCAFLHFSQQHSHIHQITLIISVLSHAAVLQTAATMPADC